jgi:transposase-like protein
MKRTPGTTPGEREDYWTKIIEEARRYPAGVSAYCIENDISKNNYYFWFKRLRQSHPEWQDLTEDASRRSRQARSKRLKKKQPKIEVAEKARRRTFTAKEKARILKEIDSAGPRQTAAILRREGIYSSHLQKWRLQRDERALAPKKRGPKVDEQAKTIKELEKKTARLEKRLAQANALIELQKKVAEILGTDLQDSDNEG